MGHFKSSTRNVSDPHYRRKHIQSIGDCLDRLQLFPSEQDVDYLLVTEHSKDSMDESSWWENTKYNSNINPCTCA